MQTRPRTSTEHQTAFPASTRPAPSRPFEQHERQQQDHRTQLAAKRHKPAVQPATLRNPATGEKPWQRIAGSGTKAGGHPQQHWRGDLQRSCTSHPAQSPGRFTNWKIYLGCRLFERRARGLALTHEGLAYLAACQEALSIIEKAPLSLRQPRRQIILLSCTAGFAIQWLLPRLQQFMGAALAIDVCVSTTNRRVDLATEGFHFAVRHGLGN